MLVLLYLQIRQLWRDLVARFRRKPEEPDDPEWLLARAQREMMEMQARNRERAVQAITQKNNLRQMVDDTQRRVDNLHTKADHAARRGDHDLEWQLLREKGQYAATLAGLQKSLAEAEEVVEGVKAAIGREEERIRRKTAEILTLKARWRMIQIQAELLAALEPPGRDESPERSRERALQAISLKNQLQQLDDGLRKRASALEAKAEAAFRRGEWRLALDLLREREGYEESLAAATAALSDAVAAVEALAATRERENGGD